MFDESAMHTSLVSQLPDISALCEKYGAAHLELFGSATGAEFNPDSSDFDFLVELDTQIPGSRAKRWTELADALEQLLGRHVDLVNPCYIRNPYFLQAVNNSRTLIYDRQNTKAAG
ncbi:MAG: DNA polymerase subunit beta [Rhodoferax sp.]|nr:DNA polymerase subunit beta [Rhodoferax sp.]